MISLNLRVIRSKKVMLPLAIIMIFMIAHWIKTHRKQTDTASASSEHQLAPLSPLPREMSADTDTISTKDTSSNSRETRQWARLRPIEPFNPPPYQPPPSTPKASSPVHQALATQASPAPPMTLYQITKSQPPPTIREQPTLHAEPSPDATQLLGQLIPCILINGIQSSPAKAPIEAWVTDDVWAHGTLIIPRGTTVHGTTLPGRVRDRVHADGHWLIVRDDASQVQFTGHALHRDLDPMTKAYGLADMTLGLQGRLQDAPDFTAQKRILASLARALSQSTQDTVHTVFGPKSSRNLGNVARDTVDALSSQRLQALDQQSSQDNQYVLINAATEFYIRVRSLDGFSPRASARQQPRSSNEPLSTQ